MDENEIVESVNALIRAAYARDQFAKEPNEQDIEFAATQLLSELGVESFYFAAYPFESKGKDGERFAYRCPQVFLRRWHE